MSKNPFAPGGPDGPPLDESPKGPAYFAGAILACVVLGLVGSILVGGLFLASVKIWSAVFA